MIGYRIIRTDKKWHFEFIPNNNKNQPIGKSKYYSSENECKEAIKCFHDLIINEHIDSDISSFVKINETENGWYSQYQVNNEIIFKSRVYKGSSAKSNCKKCIVSIYKHIDDYTFNRIKETS